jgi:hypothetical protein
MVRLETIVNWSSSLPALADGAYDATQRQRAEAIPDRHLSCVLSLTLALQ